MAFLRSEGVGRRSPEAQRRTLWRRVRFFSPAEWLRSRAFQRLRGPAPTKVEGAWVVGVRGRFRLASCETALQGGGKLFEAKLRPSLQP